MESEAPGAAFAAPSAAVVEASTAYTAAAILDSVSDGILLLDRRCRILQLNEKARELVASVTSPLSGRVLWDALPDIAEDVRASIASAADHGTAGVFDMFYPAPLERWLEVRASPCPEGVLLFIQDHTERRALRSERERLLASEGLARAEADSAHKAVAHARRELAHRASHDALTGLMNRAEFERLTAARLASRHPSGAPPAMVLLDLDRFTAVNDALGHETGDALLVLLADRVVQAVGAAGVTARLGDDEFVVLVEGLSSSSVMTLCDRLLSEIERPTNLLGHTITTTASIGLASAQTVTSSATLLRNADAALRQAKDAGRNGWAWFDAGAHRDSVERGDLERELRVAIEGGDIEMHYQGIFSLADERLAGVEALARWQRAPSDLVPPSVFIPLAEEAGLMGRLGRQVTRLAVAQAKLWQDIPDFTVWINVSGRQLSTAQSADGLVAEFTDVDMPRGRLGVEITESALADEKIAVRALRTLASHGVEVAVDDFGTGYSSLSRLSQLPVSVLKIDRSFTCGAETVRGRASLDAIVRLAETNGMRTVAEGVETARQLDIVRDAGVTLASGYLLGRAAPAEELVRHFPQL